MDIASIGVAKAAVVCCSGIGDFLMATPAIEALAHGYPGADIHLIARQWHLDFVQGRYPYIRQVHIVPRWAGVSDEESGVDSDEFFGRMAEERFDIAVQMQDGGGEVNAFVRRLGARLSVGYSSLRERRSSDLPDVGLRYLPYTPEVMRHLELVGLLGVEPRRFEPEAQALERDRQEAHGLMDGFAEENEEVAVLHPGAGSGRRLWPIERFARVADRLIEDYGIKVVVVGVSPDFPRTQRLRECAAHPERMLDLVGKTTAGGLIGVIDRARLFLGNCSGPAHLAAALRIPSVVVFGCGDLIREAPFARQVFRPVISWRTQCPVCGARDSCPDEASWMDEAPEEEVIENAVDLMDSGQPEVWGIMFGGKAA